MAVGQLDRVGYALLQADRVEDAIEIYKLNVEFFPEQSRPYDSLGKAYLIKGDREKAIGYYRKSLELNPDNENAVEQLEKLAAG